MKTPSLLRYGALPLAMGILPLLLQADAINGTITGKTVSANGPKDVDTATTIGITFQTYCPWIVNGASAYPASNFVFAGLGVASGFTDVSASDFTISNYIPWVVNNNATTNNLTNPAGQNQNRNIKNQDAGGADIIISYTPANKNDPTNVNFVQAYVENPNNKGFSKGVIDAAAASPYYNFDSYSGTGNVNRTGTVPLVANATTAAWMADIPYDCASGSGPTCTGAGTLSSDDVYFQTFIEANEQIKGKTYQVLFGGVQWGFDYQNSPIPAPEPSVLLLTGSGLLGLGVFRRRRRSGFERQH